MQANRFVAVLGLALAMPIASLASSPYAGQDAREIKALDGAFVDGLRDGAGLGFAKAAELNGYPGPAHLLELADGVGLSSDQKAGIQSIFEAMRADSIALGERYLEAERALDAAFREKSVTPATLGALTAAAGAIEARLRERHLRAHIEATALLNDHQIATYQRLRGYGSKDHGGHKKHH